MRLSQLARKLNLETKVVVEAVGAESGNSIIRWAKSRDRLRLEMAVEQRIKRAKLEAMIQETQQTIDKLEKDIQDAYDELPNS